MLSNVVLMSCAFAGFCICNEGIQGTKCQCGVDVFCINDCGLNGFCDCGALCDAYVRSAVLVI